MRTSIHQYDKVYDLNNASRFLESSLKASLSCDNILKQLISQAHDQTRYSSDVRSSKGGGGQVGSAFWELPSRKCFESFAIFTVNLCYTLYLYNTTRTPCSYITVMLYYRHKSLDCFLLWLNIIVSWHPISIAIVSGILDVIVDVIMQPHVSCTKLDYMYPCYFLLQTLSDIYICALDLYSFFSFTLIFSSLRRGSKYFSVKRWRLYISYNIHLSSININCCIIFQAVVLVELVAICYIELTCNNTVRNRKERLKYLYKRYRDV